MIKMHVFDDQNSKSLMAPLKSYPLILNGRISSFSWSNQSNPNSIRHILLSDYPMIWSQAVVCNAPIWDAAKLLPKVGKTNWTKWTKTQGFLTLSVEINVNG